MKLKWTSSNKPLIKFLIILFIIGIFVGIYLYLNASNIVKESVLNEISTIPELITKTRQNCLFSHLLIISIIIILSFTIIGVPLIIFYYFYESVSLGFFIATLWKWKKINGLLFSIPFTIINKLIFFALLIYIIINSLSYSKKIISNWKANKNDIIIRHLYKMGFALITILTIDTIIYFGGNKLLSIFLFLL